MEIKVRLLPAELFIKFLSCLLIIWLKLNLKGLEIWNSDNISGSEKQKEKLK